MIYSHSRLSTFEECPRKFWYAYVQKVEVPAVETVEAFLGQRVHEALEELYTRLLNGRLLTCQELLEFYLSAWNQHWRPEIRIVGREYRQADYLAVGKTALEAYFDRHYPFDQSRTLALETQIQLDLDGTGRYCLTGYIDRVAQRLDGAYEIHDYKTSRSLPTQAQADQDRQLALYQLGLQARWPDGSPVELIWHYLRFDKRIISRRNPEALASVRSLCVTLIDDIQARRQEEAAFPTRPSRLCDWCEYDAICPAMSHKVAAARLPCCF